jgi:hypothetical protein
VTEGFGDSRVIRAPTPPRDGSQPDSRETLWEVRRDEGTPFRADLIGLTDGVEIELFRNGIFKRRWRFLTDAAARGYAVRVRVRLERRAFQERRSAHRTRAWPGRR